MRSMRSLKNKINLIIVFALLMMVQMCFSVFAIWGKTEKGGIYWINANNTFPVSTWQLIDDDGDGIGYYYYFNENGFILLDDISPDYMIVNKAGRRIDYNGEEIAVKIEEIELEEGNEDVYSAEILAQINENKDVVNVQKGFNSSGQAIISVEKDDTEGPAPGDNIVIEKNDDGTARWLLGPNVKLKKDSEAAFDTTMDKQMQKYVQSGSKYSKKTNGTTFLKAKWKEVMSLNGTGATIVFENPKNNFNKLKGRIATHYFSYSDRTTQCTLFIYNEDNGEELYNTSAFNYNGGCSFECLFPKKTNAIRFELEVNGQYTSRVCYLRNCEFGFDKPSYEEELYDDEVEEAYRAVYGTDSEAEYEEEEEEVNTLGEIPVEGEDPGARYRRLNGIVDETLPYYYDEEDDSVTEAMRASISEMKKKLDAEAEVRNKVSGPAFDERLKNETEAVGPGGMSNFIEAYEGGGDDE